MKCSKNELYRTKTNSKKNGDVADWIDSDKNIEFPVITWNDPTEVFGGTFWMSHQRMHWAITEEK